MGSQPFDQSWSNLEVVPKDEDLEVLSFPSQPLPLDFSGSSGYAADIQFDHLPIQESAFDAVPMDMFVYDPFYSVVEFEPRPNMLQGYNTSGGDLWSNFGNEFKAWNHEMHLEFEMEANQPLLLCDNGRQGITLEEVTVEEKKKKIRRQREVVKGCSSSRTLSRETVSKYFYMPITQAAKELNVGLTLLKKRCRELGIRRWPHRKLMSLQTLIDNVQEMQNGVAGQIDEVKLKETISILEHEKKLMEEIPDKQMECQTKRLRQACFKANYKKRKLVGMMESQSSFLSNLIANSVVASPEFRPREEDDSDEEDLNSIFADCLSSSNSIIYQT